MGALRALLVVSTIGLLACGCSWFSGEENVDASTARTFTGFPLYWVGERFEGLELAHVDVRDNLVTFVYGDCIPAGSDEPSCTPPLEIQVAPLCSHLSAVIRSPLWRKGSIRGAPLGLIDSAPVILSRAVQIKAYPGDDADLRLSIRALGALRSANRVKPVVGPDDPIPAPPGGVATAVRSCGVGGILTAERHVVDERRGSYRGVQLGGTPDELRRVFGDKEPAGENEPLLPANVTVDDEDYGPSVIPYRVPRPAAAYRYKDVVFAFVGGRLRWFETIDPGAVTTARVAIGDPLDTVEGSYEEAKCGKAGAGDYYEYPVCVVRLRPDRFIWFGGDPIRSITVSSLPLLGVTEKVPFRGQVFELTDGQS